MTEIYLDIETQRTDKDVPGGWDNIPAFGFACAVTYCECHGGYKHWLAKYEQHAPEKVSSLVDFLRAHSRIIGHNLIKFDYAVLGFYEPCTYLWLTAKTLDTHKYLADKKKTGRYVSLDSLALATLGHGKSGSGADAPMLWRAGEYDKLLAYCEQDVRLLVELVAFAREHGYVQVQRVDVEW
jgi:hypothetical protein